MYLNSLTEIFSTRELSLLIWFLLVFFASLILKECREAIYELLKLIFFTQIGIALLVLNIYIISIVLLLLKIGIWDFTLFKDTIFWFISVALILFFNINKVKDVYFFKQILKECFKWTIALEFIVNFYTFSLLTELILMPFLIFLTLILVVTQSENKYDRVNQFLMNIFSFLGATFFIYITYKTFISYEVLFTIHNLLSFILPLVLTILIVPFIYFLAVYIKYERLYILIDIRTNDNSKKKLLKKEILLFANINLNRLTLILEKIHRIDVYHLDNLKLDLKLFINEKNYKQI